MGLSLRRSCLANELKHKDQCLLAMHEDYKEIIYLLKLIILLLFELLPLVQH